MHTDTERKAEVHTHISPPARRSTLCYLRDSLSLFWYYYYSFGGKVGKLHSLANTRAGRGRFLTSRSVGNLINACET